jgi:hypothetical protein
MGRGWLVLALLGAGIAHVAACNALVDLPVTTDAAATSASSGGSAGSTTSQGGAGAMTITGGAGGTPPNLTGDHVWSRSFGGTSFEDPLAVTIDAIGNVFVVGAFRDTIDFGGGPFDAGADSHAYVLKLDAQGNHVWSRHFGAAVGWTVGADVALASNGDVYVCGAFQGSVDFGDGVKTSDQNADGYVLRLDDLGNFVSARHFAGPGSQVAIGIALDASDNVIVAGNFTDSIDLEGDVLAVTGIESSFVVKHAADGGAWMWSSLLQGPTMYLNKMVVANDSGIFLTGYFSNYANVAGGNLLGNGSWDVLVAKLSGDGIHLWSLNGGDEELQLGVDVAVSETGAPAVTGWFMGSIDFGGGPLSSSGVYDAFAAQLSSGGGHVWTKVVGNPNYQEGHGIVVDKSDAVVHVGLFEGTIDAGGPRLQSAGERDAFVIKRDAMGEHVWSKSFGGPGFDDANVVAAGPDNSLVVAGTFVGSVDFGGGALASEGPERDIFVVKLAP